MLKWWGRCANCWVVMADRRKITSGMLLLTLMGAFLMLPPAVYVFAQPFSHFGFPQIVFYLFALWLLLIIGTALLARGISDEDLDVSTSENER
jgi:hypothetical protein